VLARTRLTPAADAVLAAADREASDLGHDTVGGEHLLLALAWHHALAGLDVDLDRLRRDLVDAAEGAHGDSAALALFGIDLEEVRRRAEELYGPDALARNGTRARRDPNFDRAVEAARREARAAGTRRVAPEHLLRGALAAATPGAGVLVAHGVTPARLEAVRRP